MANQNLLSFPKGIGTNVVSGQPYMLLTSYESKNAIESQTKILSSIALYIPLGSLSTKFDATWSETEGAATKAAMGSALGVGGDMGSILDITTAALKGTGIGALTKAAKTAEAGTGMLAAQGLAINNHMALTYKGPTTFRSHEFSFNFFPKNKDDSTIIKKILNDFEMGMLPRIGTTFGTATSKVAGRTLSAPYFQSPRHWTIDFFMKGGGMRGETGNTYLFKIKKSVITSMNINHDPNSTVSLHKDGSPVQTALSLTFQEIELPISNDQSIRVEQNIAAGRTPQAGQAAANAMEE